MTNIYTIWIRTGSGETGGTDAQVYIQLVGTQGKTEPVHLPSRDVFTFEAGSIDRFVLEVPDIGEVTRCCLGHDGSDPAGWYVAEVRIQDDDTERGWTFMFDRWIGDEGKTFSCVDL
jgi:hypothetical protein